jgi:NAD(P)-dependent dehydrogenase (short-subunit alcohol dehydrogenase family)
MRIVMTGATGGFGEIAALSLAKRGSHQLYVGARNIATALPGRSNVTVLPLDLADLNSVRDFCSALPDDEPIDALVLNAGVQLSKPKKSAQGYELTFAVNHLAHFLMLTLLEGRLAKNARVIVTSSGTHDPAEKTPVTPPDHADAHMLAYPEKDETLPKGVRSRNMRAYSSSKLCNILMVKALTRRRSDLAAMAYDPGFVSGTGLMREHPGFLVAILGKIIPLLMARDRTSNKERSGDYLAKLVTEDAYGHVKGTYWAVRDTGLEDICPSDLACDDAVADALWEDSLQLI